MTQQGKALHVSHYHLVACVYRKALDQHQPPRQAVSLWFKVSPAMASKYIHKAREMGVLDIPAQRGTANYKPHCPTCGAPQARWQRENTTP